MKLAWPVMMIPALPPVSSGATVPFRPVGPSPVQTTGPAAASQADDTDGDGGFFSELWDIINPLQHLPVIGMAYRAITGEKMDGFARVAGDALYGGLWGAIGAVADEAFEAITGRSAEDTVLAWLDLDADSTAASPPVVLAANVQTQPLDPASVTAGLPLLSSPPAAPAHASLPGGAMVGPVGLAALDNALTERGITGATARTALYAYRQGIALTGAPVPFAAD